MRDQRIVDAEFEVIEPGSRAELRAPGAPRPYAEAVSYWIAAIICTGLVIWARPYGMHLIDRLLFHRP